MTIPHRRLSLRKLRNVPALHAYDTLPAMGVLDTIASRAAAGSTVDFRLSGSPASTGWSSRSRGCSRRRARRWRCRPNGPCSWATIRSDGGATAVGMPVYLLPHHRAATRPRGLTSVLALAGG
jgi:hypothetical protein